MKEQINLEKGNPIFGDYHYPEVNLIRAEQQKVPWTDLEIPVKNDKQDYLIHMTPEQLFLCKTTLQTFVKIEQSVGEIWHTIGSWFPHPEIDAACSVIESMEKGVHAFFYQKMSDVLCIEPKEIDRIQKEYGPIKNKLVLIEEAFLNAKEGKNKAVVLATVSLIEQVLLFGNFAMLKSFKANGNNMINNTLFGVEYVIFDESVHGSLSTFLFKTYCHEKEFTKEETSLINKQIEKILTSVIFHETEVINMVFKDTDQINGITKDDLINFVKHRANLVIDSLGIDIKKEIVVSNPIADWFYNDINAVKMHDFFSGGTIDYRKDWSEAKFSALAYIKEYIGK